MDSGLVDENKRAAFAELVYRTNKLTTIKQTDFALSLNDSGNRSVYGMVFDKKDGIAYFGGAGLVVGSSEAAIAIGEDMTTGAVSGKFIAGTWIESLAIYEGKVYASGPNSKTVMKLEDSTWDVVDYGVRCVPQSCEGTAYLYVDSKLPWAGTLLSIEGDDVDSKLKGLYAGGRFDKVGSITLCGNIGKYDAVNSWQCLDLGVSKDGETNQAIVRGLVFMGNVLYVGGAFDKTDSVSVSNLAAWNGEGWNKLEVEGGGSTAINGDKSMVRAMTADGTSLYLAINDGDDRGTKGEYSGNTDNTVIEKWTKEEVGGKWKVTKLSCDSELVCDDNFSEKQAIAITGRVTGMSIIRAVYLIGGENINN